MYFNLQSDTGSAISFYLVPDSFTKLATARIRSGGVDVLDLHPTVTIESLVTVGRHETGKCGFEVDNGALPGLENMNDLEIVEAETGLLVYRRPLAGMVDRKIVRVELSLLPHWRLDSSFVGKFQYMATAIEQYGAESVMQMFLLDFVPSIYISGRIQYRGVMQYIEGKFETMAIVQDPYDELAERLLALCRINQMQDSRYARDVLMFRAAIEFAERLGQDDPLMSNLAKVSEAFGSIDDAAADALSNPFVRQLTCATPRELPGRQAIAQALDMLASCTVVGLRDNLEEFHAALSESLGIQYKLQVAPHLSAVKALAGHLRTVPAVEDLISIDLDLYNHVLAAAESAQRSAQMESVSINGQS